MLSPATLALGAAASGEAVYSAEAAGAPTQAACWAEKAAALALRGFVRCVITTSKANSASPTWPIIRMVGRSPRKTVDSAGSIVGIIPRWRRRKSKCPGRLPLESTGAGFIRCLVLCSLESPPPTGGPDRGQTQQRGEQAADHAEATHLPERTLICTVRYLLPGFRFGWSRRWWRELGRSRDHDGLRICTV